MPSPAGCRGWTRTNVFQVMSLVWDHLQSLCHGFLVVLFNQERTATPRNHCAASNPYRHAVCCPRTMGSSLGWWGIRDLHPGHYSSSY